MNQTGCLAKFGEDSPRPFVGRCVSKEGLAGQTRYFFAARLKYSRYMYVSFHSDMREETLLRCLIACCVDLGGVPWVVTTDNMKTVTLGRDAQHQPIWHPAFQKLAVEFGFHPDACSLAAGNQKGAVESLVKFVKGNFLAGRTFYDDELRARLGRNAAEDAAKRFRLDAQLDATLAWYAEAIRDWGGWRRAAA